MVLSKQKYLIMYVILLIYYIIVSFAISPDSIWLLRYG